MTGNIGLSHTLTSLVGTINLFSGYNSESDVLKHSGGEFRLNNMKIFIATQGHSGNGSSYQRNLETLLAGRH